MASKAFIALACVVAVAAILDCTVAASDVDELDRILVSMSGRSDMAPATLAGGMDLDASRKLLQLLRPADTPADEAGPAADYLARGFRFLANFVGGAFDVAKIAYGGFCIFAGCALPGAV